MRDDKTKNKNPVGLIRQLLLATLVLGLLVFTQLFTPGHPDLWLQSMLQFLHAPMFGVIAVALLAMTPSGWHWRKRLLVSLGTVLLLALLSEAAQIPLSNRSASLNDLVNDWLGALAFLAVAVALSPNFHVPSGRGRYLVLIAAALMYFPLKPLYSVSVAYWERFQQLPSIAPLQARSARTFFELNNAIVVYRSSKDDRRITEIRFGKEGSASIKFHDPWSDWRGHNSVLFDLENPDNKPLPLTIRIHDEIHLRGNQPHQDRFNRRIKLKEGRHSIRVSLSEVRNAPADRLTDLRRIDGVVIFGTGAESSQRFIIHDIRLN